MTIPPPMASDERRPHVGGLGPGLLGPQAAWPPSSRRPSRTSPCSMRSASGFGVMGRCRSG
jgi:hypothetical protein